MISCFRLIVWGLGLSQNCSFGGRRSNSLGHVASCTAQKTIDREGGSAVQKNRWTYTPVAMKVIFFVRMLSYFPNPSSSTNHRQALYNLSCNAPAPNPNPRPRNPYMEHKPSISASSFKVFRRYRKKWGSCVYMSIWYRHFSLYIQMVLYRQAR